MTPHPIAVINPWAQDRAMELLIPLLLTAILGVLAQAVGIDSRDADPHHHRPSW
jgi:hypothetical protein